MQKSETGMNINTLNHANNDKELAHNEDDQKRKPNFLFSVDYILNKAGNTNTNDVCNNENQNGQHFEWLYCTRFKPPKLDSKFIYIIQFNCLNGKYFINFKNQY